MMTMSEDDIENRIWIGLGVEDLIEKPVEGRRGPATVSASESAIVHWGTPWEGAEEQ